MKKSKQPDWIFRCDKCGHEVYSDKKDELYKFLELECPECGEEAYHNWVLVGEGNFEKR